MANKEKLDVEKVITEYLMLKTVLNNKYSMNIVKGKVPPAGPSAEADRRTLQAIQRYVKTLDELVVSKGGLTRGENLDQFLTRLIRNMKAEELGVDPRRATYSDNPFDDNFKYYVKELLSHENARDRIGNAISNDSLVVNNINSLVVNLGGKKQSSYIKILAQSTNLFATVSGLKQQLETLSSQRKIDNEKIASLREQLAQKSAEAKKYQDLCEKAIEELGNSGSTTVLVSMMKETSNSLSDVIRFEAENTRRHVSVEAENTRRHASNEANSTREHVTNEVDRALNYLGENTYELTAAENRIKSYIYSNADKFPRCYGIYIGRKENFKGLKNVFYEVKSAAEINNLGKNTKAVDNVYNYFVKMNEGLGKEQPTNNPQKKSKHVGTKIICGILIGTSLFFGAKYMTTKNALNIANEEIVNVTQAYDSTYQSQYDKYCKNEKAELNDYLQKLQFAIDDNTLVTLPGEEAKAPSDNGKVWDQQSLSELRDQYAKTDNINKFGWSSTASMDYETENAIMDTQIDYYETHYEELKTQVSQLTQQVDSLNSKISQLEKDNADLIASSTNYEQTKAQLEATITTLETTIQALQDQVSSLSSLLEQAEKENGELRTQVSGLQAQLDEANENLEYLQSINEILTQENAALVAQIASLNSQVSDLETTVQQLSSEKEVLSSQKAALMIQVAQLQSTVDSLNRQIEGMGGADLYEQKVALEQRVAELENMIETANDTIKQLKAENEQLTQQIVVLNQKISVLDADVNNLKSAIESLSAENTSLKSEVNNLKISLGESMDSYNKLLEMYNQLKNNGSSAEIESLKAEINEYKNLIKYYEESIVSFYNGLTKQNTDTTEAKKDLEELFKMFGFNYSEQDSPTNDGSEYQPH